MSDSSADRNPLDLLAEEFVARFRAGQRPSLTEYAERHPELADEIREVFPALVEMEQFKPVTADGTGAFVEPGDAALPDHIGEFRILRMVGQGGMGRVYEAVQESLGRHVALKVLPADALLDPKRRERFRREARAAAKLHHTNIVPVFGTGEADGRHYYAMQFIAGHPLDAVIDEVRRLKAESAPGPSPRAVSEVAASLMTGSFGLASDQASARRANGESTSRLRCDARQDQSLPGSESPSLSSSLADGGRHYWATVARLGAQVADALAYAHGQGVLHRDVKPANLLLDHRGTVWIADFGLAKADDSEDLTQAGDMVGTLRYMAPERFDGAGDQRADLYALGLTLYELLTLKPAFAADNRAKLVQEVTAADPPRPRSHNPAIPRDIETVVLKAIQRDPRLRYGTAAELADDLRRFVEDRPIQARRATAIEQAWRWCRRNPAVASLLAAVVLVTAGGFAATVHQMTVARANAARADESAAHAEARTEEAMQEKLAQQSLNEQLKVKQDELGRTLYAAHMGLIPAAFAAGNASRVIDLLEQHRPRVGEPNLRGFEWNYWQRQVHREAAVFRPPTEAQTNALLMLSGAGSPLVLSPDGTHVAILDSHGLRAWDVNAHRLVANRKDLALPKTAIVPWIRGQSGLSFSPDSRRIAIFSPGSAPWGEDPPAKGPAGSRIAVVEVDGGATDYELPLPIQSAAAMVHLAFGPKGDRLAVVSMSRAGSGGRESTRSTVSLHDLVARRQLAEVPLPDGAVDSAPRFGPDGQRLIASVQSMRESKTLVLDASTGAEVTEPEPAARPTTSPDGRRQVIVDRRRFGRTGQTPSLRVVDTASGKDVWTAEIPFGFGTFLFSPDGKRLAGCSTGSGFGTFGADKVRIWNAETGAALPAPTGLTAGLVAAAFRPDGRFVTLDGGGAVKTWDLAAPPPPVAMLISSISFAGRATEVTPDGRLSVGTRGGPRPGAAAKADDKGHLIVTDDSGREVLKVPLADRLEAVWFTDFGLSRTPLLSPDGSKLAIVSFQRSRRADAANAPPTIAVWDIATGRELWRTAPTAADDDGSVSLGTEAAAFSPDSRIVAKVKMPSPLAPTKSGARTFSEGFWDATTGQEPRPAVVTLWDATTGRELRQLTANVPTATALAFSPDGRRMAVGGLRGSIGERLGSTVQEIDLASGATVRQYDLPISAAMRFQYSPDGRWLAATTTAIGTGNRVTAAWIWQAEGEPAMRDLAGSGQVIRDLAFSPDSRRVATIGQVGNRGEVKVWDPATGRELLTILHDERADGVRFSGDGNSLFIFGSRGRRSYDATPLPPEIEAADVADRLPPAETNEAIAEHLDRLGLPPALRARVAELARPTPRLAARNSTSPAQFMRPGRPEKFYRDALAAAEAEQKRDPSAPTGWLQSGVARFRLGLYPEALADLTKYRATANPRPGPTSGLAFSLAFLAMAQQRTGKTDEAKATLAEARAAVGAPTSPAPNGLVALLAEAEALIDPKPGIPEKP